MASPRPDPAIALPADLNLEAAGMLRDLSIVHPSEHARVAYRRAARALLDLDVPVDVLARSGRLREVRHVGPSTERLVLELLEHGSSATVEGTVAASGKAEEVREARSLREGFLSRAAVLSVLAADVPGVLALADVAGDLQTHTTWSDGAEDVSTLADAARARGHDWLGVSDHAHGLKIARGMSMADAARQRAEIDALNARLGGAFTVIQGVEANILADGALDLSPGERATFEIVLAAPHARLRRAEDQTERMLAAVRAPGVHVLAHPRGRMMTRRGVLADWDFVFAEAARRDVAVELDGDGWRQDLDWALARRALDVGCRFAVDSDAHSGAGLAMAETGVAHARLAGIPRERVINAWPADRLRAWAASRRA